MKSKLILSILFVFCFSNIGHTIEKECVKNPMFGYFYHQSKYTVHDYNEDIILANLAKRTTESFLYRFKIKDFDKQKREYFHNEILKNCKGYETPHRRSPRNYITTMQHKSLGDCRKQLQETKTKDLNCKWNKIIRKSPINVKKTTDSFKAIISEYEDKNKTKVYRSRPHSWDPKNKYKLVQGGFHGSIIFSKLLTSLSLGVTSKFMMTPNDQDLRSWLESQNFASVSLEDIFKKSLELQKGDLYKTILSIENVLSEYWRDKKRETLRQTASLQSITNYCPGTHKEDIFGSWYHLFGTMLLGCVEGLFGVILLEELRPLEEEF